MSQWEKLIADILAENPNLRFDSIYKALVRIGYTPSQPKSGSSHYTFCKAGHMPITVPKHGPLKRAYIELAAEAVQSCLAEVSAQTSRTVLQRGRHFHEPVLFVLAQQGDLNQVKGQL